MWCSLEVAVQCSQSFSISLITPLCCAMQHQDAYLNMYNEFPVKTVYYSHWMTLANICQQSDKTGVSLLTREDVWSCTVWYRTAQHPSMPWEFTTCCVPCQFFYKYKVSLKLLICVPASDSKSWCDDQEVLLFSFLHLMCYHLSIYPLVI